MKWLAIYLFLLDVTNWIKISCSASEFNLQGDYLLGGFFSLNTIFKPEPWSYPVAVECDRYHFEESGYLMFQVMRFAVEEINNSSTLLPNVFLGYEIFNHCSDTQNIPSVFSIISRNGSVQVLKHDKNYQPKIIAVVGPHQSTMTINVAPLFMLDLIPLVSYGSTSNDLSNKDLYPSFLRTVPSNKDLIEIIIRIIKWFNWNWVAFLGGKGDYSKDGLSLFDQAARENAICLAYQELLEVDSNYKKTLESIDTFNINVIVVFATDVIAENIIKAAIKYNTGHKVWIASEGWSMNTDLFQEPGLENIGKIFGITEKFTALSGFSEYIYKTRGNDDNGGGWAPGKKTPPQTTEKLCNQVCENCSLLNSENILNERSTFSFPVYAAVYTMAHALHNILRCDANSCDKSIPVYPYKLLREMKKLNFSLNGRQIMYDYNGNPLVSYAIILWHPESTSQAFEMIGSYDTFPKTTFTINNTLINWEDGSVPFGNCSVQCKPGHYMKKEQNHDCCFECIICQVNTYVNSTRDPFNCISCNDGDWSLEGSTSCSKRIIKYLHLKDIFSILMLLSAASMVILCIAITILFLFSYNTPVVKSAGGNMCFLMLASLLLSSISVFFFIGEPTVTHCIFRNVMFCIFYCICLSCLSVRSFQIFCVFKIANKFPEFYKCWVKNNGQWLFIGIVSTVQCIICILWVTVNTPVPARDESSYLDQIILICSLGNLWVVYITTCHLMALSSLCFFFSYMCSDLPKNYNEAKTITFSMLLFYISWCIYFTADIISNDIYVQLLNAMAQLFSLYSILLSYFIPKSFIIIFQPHKNTQAYFQTSIQTYTQTISRM